MSRRRFFAGSLLLVLVVLAIVGPAARPAAAQSVSGALTGTIVDETGQVLLGATVTLIDEKRNTTVRSFTTGDNGRFVFDAIQPGVYTIKVEIPGFRTALQQNVNLPAGERRSVGNITLSIGGVTETITAHAEGSFVQTNSSDRSALLSSKQIDQLAVRGRDVISLLKTLPGVAYLSAAESESLGSRFGTDTPNISGTRKEWNTVTVDGLVGNDLGSPNNFASAINFDAIGEVKVQLGNFRAENGRNGGGIVSIVTKSGSQSFSGSLYAYKRDESLNANNYFNNLNGVKKAPYRFSTEGVSIGGPALIPGINSKRDKLFFFYSFENSFSSDAQPLRTVTVPTALERTGDFSQSLDSSGRAITVTDPTTGQAFPGGRIPAGRFDASGLALLNLFPMPNALDRNVTKGQYNYVFQESLKVPKHQHVARVDWKPNEKDSLYVRGMTWYADNKGYAVPAGASNWGLVQGHYTFTDKSALVNHTHVFSPNLVNEASFGARQSNEAGPPLTQEGLDRVTRAGSGFVAPQFHPEINPLNMIPMATFGGVTNPANITYDGRFPVTGEDQVFNVNEGLTYIKGDHVFKFGMYWEYVRNVEGPQGTFAGNFDFGRDVNNPLDSGYAYSNALLGNYLSYTESTTRPLPDGRGSDVEWYAQDTWRPVKRITLDYGVRFARYTQYHQVDGQAAAFALDRYSLAARPRLYVPTLVNGKRQGFDAQTGAVVPAVLIGAIVPGSGDPVNGMVVGTDASYPQGFKNQEKILTEPRIGVAWDVDGTGKTAVRANIGLFHNTRARGTENRSAVRDPPVQFNPTIYYSNIASLSSANTGAIFPSAVLGFEKDTKTPQLVSYTIGVQRDIGWRTVVDVAYVGNRGKNLLQAENINTVPYGARFLPQNQDPTQAGRALPDNFFRPFPGYGDITFYLNNGKSQYDALQITANRRFTAGLQFGVAYTYSRSMDNGSAEASALPIYQDIHDWTWARSTFDQPHMLVINYTWDLPRASKLWDNAVIRAVFDDWQLSGITAFASGQPAGITLTTVDTTDLTGGGDQAGSNPNASTRPIVTGNPTLGSGQDPLHWFDTTVFRRPAVGEIQTTTPFGNVARDIIRQPGVHNWDMTFFKNIPIGGADRRVQFRWEIYNIFNHTQFSDTDRTVRFDAAGNQTNARFGQVIAARQPRVMQGSIKFLF
jgi:hypothetical protein